GWLSTERPVPPVTKRIPPWARTLNVSLFKEENVEFCESAHTNAPLCWAKALVPAAKESVPFAMVWLPSAVEADPAARVEYPIAVEYLPNAGLPLPMAVD